jgi:hypothetical protein
VPRRPPLQALPSKYETRGSTACACALCTDVPSSNLHGG